MLPMVNGLDVCSLCLVTLAINSFAPLISIGPSYRASMVPSNKSIVNSISQCVDNPRTLAKYSSNLGFCPSVSITTLAKYSSHPPLIVQLLLRLR